MISKLAILYNTLKMIETKGDSTKVMSDCLKYLEQLIEEERKNAEKEAVTTDSDDQEA